MKREKKTMIEGMNLRHVALGFSFCAFRWICQMVHRLLRPKVGKEVSFNFLLRFNHVERHLGRRGRQGVGEPGVTEPEKAIAAFGEVAVPSAQLKFKFSWDANVSVSSLCLSFNRIRLLYLYQLWRRSNPPTPCLT